MNKNLDNEIKILKEELNKIVFNYDIRNLYNKLYYAYTYLEEEK